LKVMEAANRNQSIQSFYLFMFMPSIAAVNSLLNYRSEWAKNIFWAFCTFYGFAFTIGMENSGSDIVRYVAELKALYGSSFTFSEAIQYFFKSGEIDVLRTFLAITVSRFTDSQSILTGIYGCIFGYFLSRNLWFLLEHLKGKLKIVTLLLVACFFMSNPIWNLTGFRMWTAAHVFVYGLLPYLFYGDRKRLWISFLSILVHFSFLFPVAVLLAYLFMGNRLTLYFLFYISTFFMAELDIGAFNRLFESVMPEIFIERTEGYRIEPSGQAAPVATRNTENWYAKYAGTIMTWSVMGFLVILFLSGKKEIHKKQEWLNLFCYILLFTSLANLLSSIPSASRFLVISRMLSLIMIALYVQNVNFNKAMKRFVWVASPGLLLFAMVALRNGIYSFSPTMLLGNPVIALFMMDENISLNDFIRIVLSWIT